MIARRKALSKVSSLVLVQRAAVEELATLAQNLGRQNLRGRQNNYSLQPETETSPALIRIEALRVELLELVTSDTAEVVDRPVARATSPGVHLLVNGLAACVFSPDLPRHWRPGELWTADVGEVNCPGCDRAIQANPELLEQLQRVASGESERIG
jgi:hypothetical protein